MFESLVVESSWDLGGHVPDDLYRELDAELERLLADGAVPADEPVLPYGSCAPSGELALDLDLSTADPAGLSDESLVEAIIGFDRLTSWAAARQARLLDELAARRPADTAPHSARWACVGSPSTPPTRSASRCACPGAARVPGSGWPGGCWPRCPTRTPCGSPA